MAEILMNRIYNFCISFPLQLSHFYFSFPFFHLQFLLLSCATINYDLYLITFCSTFAIGFFVLKQNNILLFKGLCAKFRYIWGGKWYHCVSENSTGNCPLICIHNCLGTNNKKCRTVAIFAKNVHLKEDKNLNFIGNIIIITFKTN